jgi:hypothetical protein
VLFIVVSACMFVCPAVMMCSLIFVDFSLFCLPLFLFSVLKQSK